MNELIKITENDGKQVVSARELHKFLENTDNASTWFKRQAERAMLVENEDFTSVAFLQPSGQKSIDYAINLNAAKELAMLNGGEKGKLARQYFIEMEKIAKDLQEINAPKVPQNYKEALLALVAKEEILEQQQLLIEAQAPKVIAFNKVIDNTATYTVDSLSDAVDIGRTKLFQILRSWNWVVKKEPNGTASTRYAEENRYGKTLFETIEINKKEISKKRFVLTRKGFEKAITKLNSDSLIDYAVS